MPNRLASSTSPYLLQHKDNPVEWQEWGSEAFDEAVVRDVPVLLSVGYAACHWCHVMAHESFEDAETAALMNQLFVNVKVDREERPDVDSVYMEAVQAMTGQGGWPMTVWMDHSGRPFYAGTYFPNDERHGMPSFRQVMTAVSGAWVNKRDEVFEQGQRLVEAISQTIPSRDLPSNHEIRMAYEQLASGFDSSHGGFGGAPKFPQQPVLEFLLRVRSEPWAIGADRILTTTLDAMARGGIRDQIGGGFARYSVDSRWLVPHFEKMLYDNAQLARIYLWAGIELGNAEYLDVARSTLDYLVRDLRHSSGGFFSSEDADSEGVEGKFYVWTTDEVRGVLGENADVMIAHYGLTETGNFEGTNILSVVESDRPEGLDRMNDELLAARSLRVRPALDDKVIASWNGLTIRAFAEAGAALQESKYIDIARSAAEFALSELMVDGQLMRSWRDERTSVPAFLDDHASLALGLFSLYSATAEIDWYLAATDMTNRLERFANPEGGFFSTEAGATLLAKRPVDLTDNPLPSGSALAAEALLISSLLTGGESAHDAAERTLESAGMMMERYPSMVAHHLSVAHSMASSKELAIVGPEWEQLAMAYWARFRPQVAMATSAAGSDQIPLLRDRTHPGKTLGYVCKGFTCDLPTEDPKVLSEQLDRTGISQRR